MPPALELLTNKGEISKSALHDVWNPMLCGVLGFGAAMFVNWGTRRPLFSGIQKHFIFGGLGLGLGKVVDGWRNDYLAERDAVLRHYVQLHPEDFPDPERKKYADLLLNWVPVR